MSKPTTITSLRVPTETLTEATTLTAKDSGKTFMLNTAGGFTVTLPSFLKGGNGWACRFIVKTAPTTAYIIAAVTADADKIVGNMNTSTAQTTASDFEATAGGDAVNFVANQAVIGDYIDIVTDGALWYVQGSSSVPAGLTITG